MTLGFPRKKKNGNSKFFKSIIILKIIQFINFPANNTELIFVSDSSDRRLYWTFVWRPFVKSKNFAKIVVSILFLF